MSERDPKALIRTAAVVAAGAFAAWTAAKLLRSRSADGAPPRIGPYERITVAVDRAVGWYRLPTALALAILSGVRTTLRAQNLYDTTTQQPPAPPPPADTKVRSADGTYNDLAHPAMGAAGTRFGRNVPIALTRPGSDRDVLSPSPRTVSVELLTRTAFTPASSLNLLAAAWIQFMIADWFSHGGGQKDDPWQIPLEPGDPWFENPMRILRIRSDPTRTSADAGAPPTHVNTETHWWDASQLYGSSLDEQRYIRAGRNGYVTIGRDHIENPDDTTLVQQPRLAGWWLGASLMYTLFCLEHNAICDALIARYPGWSDDALFEHARLINAALLAKIHTVEWTPAILANPTLKIAMNANWWGLAGEAIKKMVGRISDSEIISGIPGGKTDHFGVPYAITEEFVTVYRLHPLIPDEITFRSVEDDGVLQQRPFQEIAGLAVRERLAEMAMSDILYTFGRTNPGAIQLHNFPRALQRFTRPDGVVIDLAAHDILRSRELGVPRYNDFRRLLHLNAPATFEELTPNRQWAEELRRVYGGDIEKVDTTIGMFAEQPPPGFGFSDTAFRIFILMASRRLNSDRFFTTDFTSEVYTPLGMQWIGDNTMETVLLRHYPELAPALRGVANAFAPWTAVAAAAPRTEPLAAAPFVA